MSWQLKRRMWSYTAAAVIPASIYYTCPANEMERKNNNFQPGFMQSACEPALKPIVPQSIRDKDYIIISGTASKKLANDICDQLGVRLSSANMERFSDGEIFVRFNESLREKDVFIVQTCAPPVNDNVMELLLSVAAAKRSGGMSLQFHKCRPMRLTDHHDIYLLASSVTAVIPYFGYKHNRRGLPISTTHHSRFLWNAAGDLGKMLQVVGVVKVVSVDLDKDLKRAYLILFFQQKLSAALLMQHIFGLFIISILHLLLLPIGHRSLTQQC